MRGLEIKIVFELRYEREILIIKYNILAFILKSSSLETKDFVSFTMWGQTLFGKLNLDKDNNV